MTRLWLLAVAALACSAPDTPPRVPLEAAAHPTSPASTRAFVLPERDLLPESMAFDPRTGSFFVGSMHRRTIVRRDRDGRVRDWAGPERGLWSILGIKIDASRGELWANSCNMGDELPMTPADRRTRRAPRAADPRYHALAQRIATGPGAALYVADDSIGPLLVDPTSGRWRPVAVPAGPRSAA
jgi:hypothetical protein